jgi:hypothetical protein
MTVLGIWIRIILGSQIRIRIKAESPIRITVKILERWRLKMEPRRAKNAYKWRRKGSKWICLGSVGQWSHVRITLTRNRIQIRIRTKEQSRIPDPKRRIRIRHTTLWPVKTARTRSMRFGGALGGGGGAFQCHCHCGVCRVPVPL